MDALRRMRVLQVLGDLSRLRDELCEVHTRVAQLHKEEEEDYRKIPKELVDTTDRGLSAQVAEDALYSADEDFCDILHSLDDVEQYLQKASECVCPTGVVHCRDCIYARYNSLLEPGSTEPRTYLSCEYTKRELTKDDYCSKGRK